MIGIMYFFIVIIANIIGSISGMGGGILIKPLLDFIGIHSVVEISFYSSVAAFTMATTSTLRQMRNKVKIKWDIALFVSMGSFIGGIMGNGIFDYLIHFFPNENTTKLIQIMLTVLLLIFTLIYSKTSVLKFNFNSKYLFVATGVGLGTISSLLGIGGGPINVAIFMLCFGLEIKEATIYSIITIFFSQMSKIGMIVTSSQIQNIDLTMLAYIIPSALLGGFVGATISSSIHERHVKRVYQSAVMIVILINIYNAIKIVF